MNTEDLKKTINAFIAEFGKEAVVIEIPEIMRAGIESNPKLDFGARVEFIASRDRINVRAGTACYVHPLKGLDKKS